MLFPGSVDVSRQAYLGTYTFRVSSDARGTFRIRLNGAKQSSFLLDSTGHALAFKPGKAAIISVLSAVPERIDAAIKDPEAR